MSELTWILIVAAWVACGMVHAGYFYAYFQREFPSLADEMRIFDTTAALTTAFMGPIALFATLAGRSCTHGWLFPGSRP